MTDIFLLPTKAIYLANRHPRLTREEFSRRWIRHSEDVGAVDEDRAPGYSLVGLRYCLVVDPAGILACASNEYDGVALLPLRSLAMVPTLMSSTQRNEIAFADELRAFERPVNEFMMFTASDLLHAGAETETVVVEFARRRLSLDAHTYVQNLETDRAQSKAYAALLDAGLRRNVRNIAITAAPRGYNYDTITEYWFDSTDDVKSAAGTIEAFFAEQSVHTERVPTTVLVTNVLKRTGRDRP